MAQRAQSVSGVYTGPLSMAAALKWMRENDMVPPGH